MLGPFFGRDGERISSERWARLVDSDSYGEVASTSFPSLGVDVRTIWLGHDPADGSPPVIFLTRVAGDPEMPQVTSVSLTDSRKAHADVCARYNAQMILLAQGGSPRLKEGTL